MAKGKLDIERTSCQSYKKIVSLFAFLFYFVEKIIKTCSGKNKRFNL